MAAYEPDTRPRKGDRGIPEDLERRYRKQVAEQGEPPSIADELDREYEAGRKAGAAQRPAASSGSRGAPLRVGLTAPTLPAVGGPFLVELVIISADSFYNEHRAPLPSRLLVAGVVFGVLGLARGNAARPATVFAWGLVLATFYASARPGRAPAGVRAFGIIGNFLSGRYGTPGGVGAPAANVPTGNVVAGGGGATFRKR